MAATEKYKAMKNMKNASTSNNGDNNVKEDAPPKTQDQINAENNANTLKNAAEVAANSANPYAKAIGTAVKVADKISGGKATQKMGEHMNKALKATPGGKMVQDASNKLSESGAGDKIGKAASAKGGNKGGGGAPSSAKSGSFSSGSSSSGSGMKLIAIGAIGMLLPLLLFVTVFAQQDEINLGATNNSSMTDKGEVSSGGSSVGGTYVGNVVYYNQTDFKNSYGYGETIAKAGCGPTAMAMVISTLTGNNVTPVETADWSLNNGYRVSSGTSWEFYPAIAKAYGINCETISLDSLSIATHLNSGKLIIMSVKENTTFAPFDSGHFIVLTGIDSEGKISVADPYNVNNSNQKWDVSTFLNDGRSGGIWAFSK